MGEEESGLLEIQLALDIILPGQRKLHACCEIPLLTIPESSSSSKRLRKKQIKNGLPFAVTPLCQVPTRTPLKQSPLVRGPW